MGTTVFALKRARHYTFKYYNEIKMKLLFYILAALVLSGVFYAVSPFTFGEQGSSEKNNWQNVKAISTSDAIGVRLQLVRMLDYWHQGEHENIRLRFSLNEQGIRDGFGNLFKTTPEEWKGLVLDVHRRIENANRISPEENINYAVAMAGSEELYDDGLGRVERFVYRFRIVDQTTIDVENVGPRAHVR